MNKKRIFVYGAVVIVLLLGLAAAGLFAYIMHRTEGQYFDSDGVRIHFVDEGQGEPVILVHGFAVNADINWRKPGILDALKEKYRVIALDNRGHGLSDKPHDAEQYGMNMVGDVIRLMDHLEIEKAHVIGYSMGGFITLKLITEYPDRLISAAPCAAGWEEPDNNREVLDGLVQSLENGGGFEPLIRRLEPGGGEPNFLKMAVVNAVIGALNDKMALAQIMKKFPDNHVEESQLRANKVPTLSVVGTEDPLRTGIDRMIGVMANHEVVFIEGADHGSALFNPRYCRQYIDALLKFLSEHSAAKQADAA